MRKILTLLILLTAAASVNAQFPMGAGAAGNKTGRSGQNMNIGHFYGKIVDSKTNKGIGGVTLQLVGNKYDTAKKQLRQVILKTLITENHGDFSLEDLPLFGNFKLKIAAVGYKPIEKALSFNLKMPAKGTGTPSAATSNVAQDANGGGGMSGMQQMLGQVDKDLGNIKLEASAEDLGNVTVTASSKPQFELGIDRKIFNVDKNLTSSGQTATEVMKSIPSVSVDIDGNVTLRNAAPTIFIDNRPTTLTLDQIPSDIIDRVEIITNPSAKYDASGGGAGIINIVLKKNKKNGYNGGIRTGVDSRGKLNAGGDFNFRQNKINFFLNGMYMQRKSIVNGMIDRNNFLDTPSTINTTSTVTTDGYFGFLRGGFDYFLDNRNTISLTGTYTKGHFNNNATELVDSIINSNYASYSNILSNAVTMFQNEGGQLSFKHNFAKNGHDWTADFNYNSSTNTNTADLSTYTYYPTGIQEGQGLLQQTIGSGYNHFYTIQSDYENPITDNSKFEAGVRAAIRDFYNSSDQLLYDYTTNNYVLIPYISSQYKYTDQVYAAYATYNFKVSKWSYLLGLRAESSNYKGTLLNSSGADSLNFKVTYPISLFPSAFVTYKIDAAQDFQINYSRKINRPNFFQLMPFPNYSDPQNISIGNSNLHPEFTNLFEMSYNNAYRSGSNFLATIFAKYTTDPITRYVYYDKNAIGGAGDSAYYNSYTNGNYSLAYGLELVNKTAITKWWDLTLSANLYNSQINANVSGQSLNNQLVSWSGKMNNNFKLAKGLTLQFSGDYQSRAVQPQNTSGGGGGGGSAMFGGGGPGGGSPATAQGYVLSRYSFDAAIRKEWTWKNGKSGALTLSMNDIFRTQLQRVYSESALFDQTSQRRRDPQVVRLNFSFRFGKFDVGLLKRKNTKADQSGGMDMMQN